MKKAQDITLTKENLDIGVLGKDCTFRKLNEDEIGLHLLNLDNPVMEIDG